MNRFSCLLIMCAAIVVHVAGCQSGESPAGDAKSKAAPASPVSLTNRIWIRADKSDLPGVMRLFLTDGTLVMDSCWETYRLAKWRMEPDQTLVWNEDGMDIRAKVVVLNEGELVLSVELKSGAEEQRYQVAPAPYVCPDMPR